MKNKYKTQRTWLIAIMLGLSSAVQAGTIVNWGAPGGDLNIVTAATPMVQNATYPNSYINPANGVNGYDVNAAGQTRNFYGVTDFPHVFQIGKQTTGDEIEMVKRFIDVAGTVQSMIAWESPDFLASGGVLESFTVGYNSRGGTATGHYLIETAAGWYQSNETIAGGWAENTDLIGALTWSSYSLFGVTGGGAVPADTANVLSVGAYFSNTGINWVGAKVRYFNVTVTGAVNLPPVADAQSVMTDMNSFVDITLTGSDPEGSNLTYSVGTPANGELTGATNNWTYTPDTDYIGPDSFTFTVNDGDTNSAPATVSISVALPTQPIVQWGALGGQTTITTNAADGTKYPGVYSESTSLNYTPIGTDDYYPDTTGRSPVYYGAAGIVGDSLGFGVVNEVRDYATGDGQAVNGRVDVGGSVSAMTTWLSTGEYGFFRLGGSVERFNAQIQSRDTSSEGALSWLVNQGGQWYISDQSNTFTSVQSTLAVDASTLTWSEFIPFGLGGNATNEYSVGASAGSLVLTNVTGVGYFVSLDNVNATLARWVGSRLTYFSVDAHGAYEVDSDYERWAVSYGLIGADWDPNLDYELDGLENLMEYALGGDPTIDDAATVSPGTFMAADGGSTWFYHVYDERTDDASLIFTVGATPNLVITAPDANDVEFVGETAESGGFKTVTNRTEATSDAKFIALEVTQ